MNKSLVKKVLQNGAQVGLGIVFIKCGGMVMSISDNVAEKVTIEICDDDGNLEKQNKTWGYISGVCDMVGTAYCAMGGFLIANCIITKFTSK